MPSLARYIRGHGRRKPAAPARIDGSHPLARGLGACWLFNESAPCGAKNIVTGGGWSPNFGGGNNAPPAVPGPFGRSAYHWAGANDNGIAPDSNLGFQPASITVLAWVRPTATQTSRIFVDSFRTNVNNGWALGISDSSSNVVKWYTATSSTGDTRAASFALTNHLWYQCVGTFDDASGAKKLYVNTKLEDSTTWAHSIDYTGATSVFGALVAGGSNQVWVGDTDHVLIWDRALSAAEIALLYAEPFSFLQTPAPRAFFFGGATVDASPSAPAAGAAWSAPAPSDSTGDTLGAPAAGGTLDAPLPAAGAGITSAAPAASAAWDAPAPVAGVSQGVSVSALVGGLVWDAPPAFPAAGWSEAARFALAVWDAPAPALAGGATSAAPAATAAWDAPPPSAGTSTGVLEDFLVGPVYWDAPPPAGLADLTADAPAAGLTAGAPVPDAAADATADAAPAPAAVWDAPVPGVGLSEGVLADFLVGPAYWDAPAPAPPAAAAPEPPGPGLHNLPLTGVGG